MQASGTDRDQALTNLKTELGSIKTVVTNIAKSLGHPALRWTLIVCGALGALGGGFYAAYEAHQAVETTKTVPTSHP